VIHAQIVPRPLVENGVVGSDAPDPRAYKMKRPRFAGTYPKIGE
jgi:hypothetical protein